MTDSSLFQLLTETFQAKYQINLGLERPDDSIVLTLSDECEVTAKRLIRPVQLHDLERLQRMIESIRFGITIENGASAPQLLRAMTQGRARWSIAT